LRFRHRHVLDLSDWRREEYELVLDQARVFEELLDRPIKKVPALRGKMVVNLFFEPSTRTRVSFELAAKVLGADVINWSSSGSSTSKGETLKDTAWTLEAMGADAVVVRHGGIGAPHFLAERLRHALVINAGDGKHAHPTQALLDLYTAWKRFGRLEGLKVAILGDISHSRVARSDVQAFKAMGAQVVLCGPRTMIPLEVEALGCACEPDPRRAVEDAQVIYLLRIQKERIGEVLFPTESEYHRRYGATRELLELAPKDAVVMHPGPINRGVEIESAVADGDRSLILDQVKSGVAVRMALLFLCLGGGGR